ncbi:hypothetical protein DM860_010404 [Cuscuta australis]|uniref:Phytosulfokine n=1 Tax=Cuscuta australis TaxID=267555 RepID=A0A328E2Q1_9ASTE|nr:hypothetical protein DM860_010404 [Cuscuta australis]
MRKVVFLFICSVLFTCSILPISTYGTQDIISPTRGDQKKEKDEILLNATPPFTPQEDIATLMGLEERCEEKEEGCLERRMVVEAHLDYIYTQQRKSKQP